MRYSTEPKYRKYGKGYGFLSFARIFGYKCGKKLMDTAMKTGINAAKTASKRAVHKTSEATGDLIGNKIVDTMTSVGKPKENKENRRNLHTTRKETANYWWRKIVLAPYKSGIPKITNLLVTTLDNVPRFITKKWIEVHD